jgi:hypothetical protein
MSVTDSIIEYNTHTHTHRLIQNLTHSVFNIHGHFFCVLKVFIVKPTLMTVNQTCVKIMVPVWMVSKIITVIVKLGLKVKEFL